MKKRTAELILKDSEKFAHHDRVFLNNPVVMQGMGLAPLVVVATTGQNSLMLAAAVALLLVPSRVLACLLSRLVPLRDEEPTPEQLQKKLLPRALLYAASAAVVYLAAYPILNFVFGTGLLNLGIYLPMLVVEPLLTYRFGRVQETVHKAVSKGVRITVGYALLLLVVGIVREWLSLGTVFGAPVGRWALLPLAKMPAGGFIVLGILCAIWRAAAAKRKEYLQKEARDTLTVHYQKEARPRTVKEVVSSSAVFFSYALLAIFAQNAVFTRALGVSRMVQLVGDDRTSSALFGMMLCITQVLVAPVAFLAGRFIAPLDNRAQLRPLVYIASIALVCLAEHLVLWLLHSLPRRSPAAAHRAAGRAEQRRAGHGAGGAHPELYPWRKPWLWPWQRPWLCAGGAAGHRGAPPPAQQSNPQSIPRPAHHAGVYRRAGAGNLWLYRTFRHPVMQTGRKRYHG